MASSAVYPTPSVGTGSSWCWWQKSRLQEDRYLKQLYQSKGAKDAKRSPQESNTQFEFGNHMRKYSHSPVCAPRKKQTSKNGIIVINSSSTSEANKKKTNNNIEVSQGSEPSSGETQSKVVETGPTTSGVMPLTHFEHFVKAKLLTSRESSPGQRASDSDAEKPKKSNSSVTCFVCRKKIREIHFQEHMIFGPMKCFKCGQTFDDCETFLSQMVKDIMGVTSCKHSFDYSSDPFAFMCFMLSNKRNYAPRSCPIVVKTELALYIEALGKLDQKQPWKAAIDLCKKELPLMEVPETPRPPQVCKAKASESSTAESKDPKQPGEGSRRLSEAVHEVQSNCSFHTLERDFEGEKITPDRITPTFNPKRHVSSNGSSQEDDSIGELLLSQNYSLEQLEQAVEYIEVDGQYRTESPRKYPPAKAPKRNARTPGNPNDQELPGQPEGQQGGGGGDEFSTEFIETPANGYYYVVRHAIEECPMCYSALCPSRFTVNVVTFLMTVVCTGCDLTIYIVPELPDGTTAGVSIVTESAAKKPKVLTKEKRKRGKGTKFTRVKKSMKTSKPQDFFYK